MKSAGSRRLAKWRSPYRGLLAPDRSGDGALILDRNPRSSGRIWAASPLPVLTCVLYGASAVLLYCAFGRQSLEFLGLFCLAFGTSVILTIATVRDLFSREQLRIHAEGLGYRWTNGLLRGSRMIPFPEIRCLRRYSVMVDGGENQPSHPEYGLAIETSGQTLCVGQCRDRDRVDQLREDLEWHLRDRYTAWVNEREYVDCEVLNASGTPPEPPFDSALSCRREWDRTEFVRRIQEERPSVLDHSAFTLIVFGVGCTPLIPSNPSIAPVLASFLVMAGLLLLAASARRTWVVRPGEITTSVRVCGLGWPRTIEIEWLARMELRRLPSNVPWKSRFELALVDLDGGDTAVFGPLTEGEARWMAGIVADVLKDALPKSGQEVYRWSVSVDAPTAGSRAMADAWLDEGLADRGSKGAGRVEKA